MFRFCRTLEVKGIQYLLRAANHTSLVGMGQPCGPTSVLTIDTYAVREDGDWENMRIAIHLHNPVLLLQGLECFTPEHAREARRLLLAARARELTVPEMLAAQQRLGESLVAAIRARYGAEFTG